MSKRMGAFQDCGHVRTLAHHLDPMSDGRGKLVVVVETGGDADMAAAIERVDRTAGVICAALVYQQSEPLDTDE